MNEKPLERLNYFNGQRLQAADLKLEQDYHIRVRRWLNRSLYSSGIASGLSVYAIKNQPRVRVTPGLAIDHLGREIILLEEQIVDVVGTHHDRNGSCDGPYLTIRYQEQVIAKEDLSCLVGGNPSDRTAWGGPARILAGAVLELNLDLPNEDSGKIPLACLTLAPGCAKIDAVDTGVRRYIGESSANKVRQYALEGVREVAAIPAVAGGRAIFVKSKVLFHVRGRQPNSVMLYLKARELSALHYTELGVHQHGLSVTGSTDESFPELNSVNTSHRHPHGTLAAVAGNAPEHNHSLRARKGYIGNGPQDSGLAAFFLIERDWGVKLGAPENLANPIADVGAFLTNLFGGPFAPVWAPETDSSVENILNDVNGTINGGGHPIAGDTDYFGPDLRHKHPISGTGTSAAVGAADSRNTAVAARTGTTLTYFHDLHIAIDGNDATDAVRQQIVSALGENLAGVWDVLGNGTETHPLADEKADAVGIKIDFLPGVTLDEGEHTIEFSVGLRNGNANGGVVQFNLYVE